MRTKLLGSFTAASTREVILRRLLLTMRLHPAILQRLGRLLPGTPRRQLWASFVSSYSYWRAVRKQLTRAEWKGVARGVPVLLYHAFSEHDDGGRFIVTRRAFARQMRLLSALRFSVIAYSTFVETLRDGRLPPRRTAVLTIDDGYVDNAQIAAGVLERHGFDATIFLVSARLGAVNDWADDSPLHRRPLMTPEDAVLLHDLGFEIGAHTRTHPLLPRLDDAQLREEVEGSKRDLERLLGVQIRAFAYPYGSVDVRAVQAVRRAGFESACTTAPRLACLGDDRLLIPRIEIKRTDSLPRFLLRVWFGGA